MNHTIKGIIIVVAITSILVLGAGMFPIMQNASARSTNTNTNTNSADSSSSSDATASNTNNINNTATATQSQEQSACAVAVTCPEGSTTVTPPPTPPTATCVPDNVNGQPATLTDDTCTASIPFTAPRDAQFAFGEACRAIPGVISFNDIEFICTFPSTPPT
jgi:cytoskeletal protein RodZ